MELNRILDIIREYRRNTNPSFDFDEEQIRAIEFGQGPLWLVAGPGTGKTDILAIRVIKHLLVEKLPARSIVVTTFTKRAANQLKVRISTLLRVIREKEQFEIIESELRIGTLHSICQDVLMERRYKQTLNFSVIDDIQQRIFVYENSTLTKKFDDYGENIKQEFTFWRYYSWIFTGELNKEYKWTDDESDEKRNFPSRRVRTKAATRLLNSIVEMNVPLASLRDGMNPSREHLAGAIKEYQQKSDDSYLIDQSRLQQKFLEFLNSQQGQTFLVGETDSDTNPGIKRILVDEYQDTNPIQEEIYFKIAEGINKNICVVGDDDQALYRFRGATVESMTLFGRRARSRLKLDSDVIPIQILNNYRSHPDIVRWLNFFISTSENMDLPGARAPNKRPLIPRSNIVGKWPAASRILSECDAHDVGAERQDLASKVASFCSYALTNGLVNKPSDICILQDSTKEKEESLATCIKNELANYDIRVFNPRSKNYHRDSTIKLFFGAFFTILDVDRKTTDVISENGYRAVVRYVDECKQDLSTYRINYGSSQLVSYVNNAIGSLKRYYDPERQKRVKSYSSSGTNEACTLRSICYNILNCEPFCSLSENDPDRAKALVEVVSIINKFASMPYGEGNQQLRDTLYYEPKDGKGIIGRFGVAKLYQTVLDIICIEGYNEPEDEEIVLPDDKIPILTIHAAKGLEFPIVIAYGYRWRDFFKPNASHQLEEKFGTQLGYGGENLPTSSQRAFQDNIRLFYVAYSRAKYCLIVLQHAADKNFTNRVYGGIDDQGKNYTEYLVTVGKRGNN